MRTSLIALLLATFVPAARSSDHLDTAAVIADPASDIGDLYAWTSADGRRLNLVMTIVGKKFSDHVRYSFQVDSSRKPGPPAASVRLSCEFNAPTAPECRAGDADHLGGEAGGEAGIRGVNGRFRVFAGLRDDPFFNNVRGTRAALDVAGAAMKAGVTLDAGGCPRFDAATVARIHEEWRNTDGGPGRNFLAGWNTAALVIEVDLDVVNAGGPMLAVWATTEIRGHTPGHARELPDGVAIDRMGRALTGNMLLGTFDGAEDSDRLKSQYNRAAPEDWVLFAPALARNLAMYDGFDGRCGNAWQSAGASPADRYTRLALMLADDRLQVNSAENRCNHYLAVERGGESGNRHDCGGRTPAYDAVDIFRSLLSRGRIGGLPDGADRDDREHPTARFPFLASPQQ